jgi:predicted acetyltransferase
MTLTIKQTKIKNLEMIYNIIKQSYNINDNTFTSFIDDYIYKKSLLNKKVLILHIDTEIIGILIYTIHSFNNYTLATIEELCIIDKYKSNGYSKKLLKKYLEILKNKYTNCYMTSIICDLRSISNIFNDYTNITLKDKNTTEEIEIINNATYIMKKWYMVNTNKNVFYIPFYTNYNTYLFFNNDDVKLNSNQKKLKKYLKSKNITLGYGIGYFNIIKIT